MACGRAFLSPVLEAAPALLLGEASYSLYLIHWGPMVAMEHHFGAGGTPGWVALLTTAGCVLASVAALKFIEKPARDWLRQKPPAYPASLATVVVPDAEP